MMTNIPILPKQESIAVEKEAASSEDIIESDMDSEDESGGESNNSADEEDSECLEEHFAATSSSFSSSEKPKLETPSYASDDIRSLPPPPKGISSIVKPHYYALEKVKVKKVKMQAKLDRLRQKAENVKKQYEDLCDQLTKKESEMAIIEADVNARADEFFEARLEEDNEWNAMYKQLRAYRDEHGDLHLEKGDNPDLEPLKKWVKKQRETKRRGSIQPFREAALERLDFLWKPKEDKWNEKYNELVSYKETHGHVLVDKDENPDLFDWVKLQQNRLCKRYKENRKTEKPPERDRLLVSIGLKGHINEMKWDLNYEAALQYKSTHGTFPSAKDPLGGWLARQKKEYFSHKEGKECKISAEQALKLEKLEFEEEPPKIDVWKERFDELVQYKKDHGCFPPVQVDKVRTKLGAWVSNQRANFKYLKEGRRHMLTDERIKMLHDIEFPWVVGRTFDTKKSWEERYEDLVAYHIEHGDCRVSVADKENFSLAKWVKRQRENYWAMKEGREKKGPMTPERAAMLESLGFSWQVRRRRNGP